MVVMTKDDVEIEQRNLPNGTVGFFAKRGQQVVGSAFVGQEEPRFTIQVDPPFRDQGIGSKLLNKVKNVLPQDAKSKFGPEAGMDTKLQKFYERRGLKVVDGQVVK
jgi:GNAT superfamily N-acetyltransferase